MCPHRVLLVALLAPAALAHAQPIVSTNDPSGIAPARAPQRRSREPSATDWSPPRIALASLKSGSNELVRRALNARFNDGDTEVASRNRNAPRLDPIDAWFAEGIDQSTRDSDASTSNAEPLGSAYLTDDSHGQTLLLLAGDFNNDGAVDATDYECARGAISDWSLDTAGAHLGRATAPTWATAFAQ